MRAEDLLEGDVTGWGVVDEVFGFGGMVIVKFKDSGQIELPRATYVDIE